MKKVIKFLLIILCIMSLTSISVYAVTYLVSRDVAFDNSNGLSSTNVQDAIDEVYAFAHNNCSSSSSGGYEEHELDPNKLKMHITNWTHRVATEGQYFHTTVLDNAYFVKNTDTTTELSYKFLQPGKFAIVYDFMTSTGNVTEKLYLRDELLKDFSNNGRCSKTETFFVEVEVNDIIKITKSSSAYTTRILKIYGMNARDSQELACPYDDGNEWTFRTNGTGFNIPCSGVYELKVAGAAGGNGGNALSGGGGNITGATGGTALVKTATTTLAKSDSLLFTIGTRGGTGGNYIYNAPNGCSSQAGSAGSPGGKAGSAGQKDGDGCLNGGGGGGGGYSTLSINGQIAITARAGSGGKGGNFNASQSGGAGGGYTTPPATAYDQSLLTYAANGTTGGAGYVTVKLVQASVRD